ncbi:MAG: diguanylate cyclase [Clostridiales bacterium]|nr:diguanylate cyclase [Clostridiales bacterium]
MFDSSERPTILVVDDAKENVSVLAELLRSDYKIRAATSGEKALDICFSDNPPDLILLDIIMPGIDGYEVCMRLKEASQTKSIPVIFVTGKINEEEEIRGFNMGAVDYIKKPYNSVIVKARVSMHLELKRYRDRLENFSYLDGLTGISNRRKFDEYLDSTWNLAVRVSMPVSMVMMDIDFFKQYNDHYGHQGGDECLVKIAQVLSKTLVRKTDFLARYGGEEFVCILPNTDADNAFIIAEKMRQNVMSLKIPHAFSDVEEIVTISAGVATKFPAKNVSSAGLVEEADKALYKSKESGRNKTSY